MRTSLRAVSLALAPMLVAGCPRGLVGGSASGSASVQVGATVSIPDPPASTATPIDERGQAEVKLAACARGDVAAQVAIVSDFIDSCHEMIVCGGLTNQFGVAIVSVLLSAALGKDLSIGSITYQGDGVYKVGDVMTMTLVLGRDTSWGKVGDVMKEGDEITVKVVDIDDTGRIRLSRKAVIMEAPDYDPAQYAGMGAPAPERGERSEHSDRGGDRGHDRGGRSGDRRPPGRGGDRGGRGGGRDPR